MKIRMYALLCLAHGSTAPRRPSRRRSSCIGFEGLEGRAIPSIGSPAPDLPPAEMEMMEHEMGLMGPEMDMMGPDVDGMQSGTEGMGDDPGYLATWGQMATITPTNDDGMGETDGRRDVAIVPTMKVRC